MCVCVYLWVIFFETYHYVTRWLGSMSHEIAETLDCLFLYFLFNNFFYSLFREKIRSRFFSSWASHHCASPRRRISSKRRSVESTPPLCAWCVGGSLGYVDENVPSKKASLSRGHQKGNRSHNNGRLWWLIFSYMFFLSTLLSAAYKNQESVKLWQSGRRNPVEN